MATLTVAGTALTGFTVLDQSNLVPRIPNVLHFPIGGGTPGVTLRQSTGLAGSIDYLCDTAELADAVYAAHLLGQPLRLDDWKRQNLVKDPTMSAALWTQAGSLGTLTHPTTGGPNGYGYFEYVMSTVNTASPMAIPIALSGTGGIPVVAGKPLIVSSYWWQSVNSNIQRYDVSWYNAAGTSLSNSSGTDLILPFEPSSTWYRESGVFTPPAGAAFARPVITWSGTYTPPQTLRVADALVEYGTELRPFFHGGSSDTASLVNGWAGVANNSVSKQYGRPALDFSYVAESPAIPHRRGRKWLVSVGGVQEVAA